MPGRPRVRMGRADRRLPHPHPAPGVGAPPRPSSALTLAPPSPSRPAPGRQRRDSGVGSGLETQETWERLSDGGKGGPEEPGDSPPLRHRPRGPPPPALFGDQPDLTCLIDTNFSARSQLPEPAQPEPRYRAGRRAQDSAGYDFSRLVQRVYQEEGMAPVRTPALRPPSPGPTFPLAPEDEAGFPPEKSCPSLAWAPSADGSIWSLELQGSLIVVGRSSGRLEVGSGGWREAGGSGCSQLQVLTASGPPGVGRHRGHPALQQ